MHAGAQPTSQIMHTETSRARHALQGRMMLLLGPPGGGKTTLLNALAGKLHSSKGLRVRFILSSTAAVWFLAIYHTPYHAAHLLPAVTQYTQSMLLFKPPKP
jgi:energy-coupling factor transporter ATP-binding protein EcfA2